MGDEEQNSQPVQTVLREKVTLGVGQVDSLIDELDDFLNENSHIFTLAGVFAAISVYLNSPMVREEFGPTANLALIAGFLLSLLTSGIALWDLLKRIREHKEWYSIQNFGLLSFGLVYSGLFLLIGSFLASFAEFWGGVLFLGAYGLGLGWIFLTLFLLGKVSDILSEIGIPDWLVSSGIILILLLGPLWIDDRTGLVSGYTTPAITGGIPIMRLIMVSFSVGLGFLWLLSLIAVMGGILKGLYQEYQRLKFW